MQYEGLKRPQSLPSSKFQIGFINPWKIERHISHTLIEILVSEME